MSYYINPIWFYLIEVCNTFKNVLFVIVFAGIVVISILEGLLLMDTDNDLFKSHENATKYIKRAVIAWGICLFLSIVIPSADTCKEMMVASVITHENVEEIEDKVKEIIDYIFEKVNETNKSDNDK